MVRPVQRISQPKSPSERSLGDVFSTALEKVRKAHDLPSAHSHSQAQGVGVPSSHVPFPQNIIIDSNQEHDYGSAYDTTLLYQDVDDTNDYIHWDQAREDNGAHKRNDDAPVFGPFLDDTMGLGWEDNGIWKSDDDAPVYGPFPDESTTSSTGEEVSTQSTAGAEGESTAQEKDTANEVSLRNNLLVTDDMTWAEWEREQERQESEAAEAASETEQVGDDLDGALDEIEDFKDQWAKDHEGVSVNDEGQLVLPAEQYDELASEWEEDWLNWWNEHRENELGPHYTEYKDAVAMELRLAALGAEILGEDPAEAISDKADEIRERETEGHWNPDDTWHPDAQDEIPADAIDVAEQQVLAESQDVRAAQVDHDRALDEMDEAALPDDVDLSWSDRKELEGLAKELDGQLGLGLPTEFVNPGDGVVVTLADEELISFVLNNWESLDENDRKVLTDVLGVEAEQIETFLDSQDAVVDAQTALGEAIDQQTSELERAVLEELAELLGVTPPDADNYRPGEMPQGPPNIADLTDEQLLALIQETLGNLDDPNECAEVLNNLDDDAQQILAISLGAEMGDLDNTISDSGQLAEALGVKDDQVADAFADILMQMAAENVSDTYDSIPYIDSLLFGNDLVPGAIDNISIDLEVGELSHIIDTIDPEELSGVEMELWDAGDKVSLALLIQLGVRFKVTEANIQNDGGKLYAEIDGEILSLSGAEVELLNEDPVALALLLSSGEFRLEGSSGDGEIFLTFNGGKVSQDNLPPVSTLQDEDAAQAFLDFLDPTLGEAIGNSSVMADLARTLWRFGDNSSDITEIVSAAGRLRLEHAGEQVAALIAEGKDDEALSLLTMHMGAALSEEERELLQKEVGMAHFGPEFWEQKINQFAEKYDGKKYLDELYDWLVEMGESISPEMASMLLEAVENGADIEYISQISGELTVAVALSPIIEMIEQAGNAELASAWAGRMAEWLSQPTEFNPTGYRIEPDNISYLVTEGEGVHLATAFRDIIGQRGDVSVYERDDYNEKFDEVLNNPPPPSGQIEQEWQWFENNKNHFVSDYFDRIMELPDIGEEQEMVYGDDLRDLIASGMDLEVENPIDLDTIDNIMEQMFIEAGIDEGDWENTPIKVTVVPYIYAAESDGWFTGALFVVDGPDSESTRTIGTVNPTTITTTDTNEFVIDGGVIANLTDQAMRQGTSIDDLTKEQPWKFDSVKDFQDKNYLSDKGLLYLPYDLGVKHGLDIDLFSPSIQGDIRVGTTVANLVTRTDEILKVVDNVVTTASLAAMFIPVGGMLIGGGLRLLGVGIRAANITRAGNGAVKFFTWTQRAVPGTLWGSMAYTAGRGGYRLAEMNRLGMDIDWSNPMARNIYIEQIGTVAGGWSMIGSPLTRKVLNKTGPGNTPTSARTAYWSTQAANTVDLGTGSYLTLDGLPHMFEGGDDVSAFDRLLFAAGAAQLYMGGSGLRQESKFYNTYRNQTPEEYIQAAIGEEAKELWWKAGAPDGKIAAFMPKAAERLFPRLVEERTHHLWQQAGGEGAKDTFQSEASREVRRVLPNLGIDPLPESTLAFGRKKLGLPDWVSETELQAINELKVLSPDEIAVLTDEKLINIESWYLLLLTREQLEAWPSPRGKGLSTLWLKTRNLSETANKLLEPTILRSRLPGMEVLTTPNHTEATTVFRGDSRGPEVIFSTGFKQREQSDLDGGVSTSLSARKARWWAQERASGGDTWVYTIVTEVSNGDIGKALPARPQHGGVPKRELDINDHEIRFMGDMPGRNVLAARRVDSDGNFGEVVYNPDFYDSSMLPNGYHGRGGTGPSALSAADHDPFSLSYNSQPSAAALRKSRVPPLSELLPGKSPVDRFRENLAFHELLDRHGETPYYNAARNAVDEVMATGFLNNPHSGAPDTIPFIYRHTQQEDAPPKGRARLYHFDDLEALKQASENGELPPDNYVHVIRSRAPLNTYSFTMNSGTVLKGLSGQVDDDGHIQWAGHAPKNFTGLYAIVTELSPDHVREKLQSEEGLPFAEYDGDGAWASPARQPSDDWQVTFKDFLKNPKKVLSIWNQNPINKEILEQLSWKEKIAAAVLSTGFVVGPFISQSPLAGPVAQMLRGISMATRGGFEDASAIRETQDIPIWGRWLRGMEFYTTMVSLPRTLHLGDSGNPTAAEGAYALGMALYATDGYFEAITGKDFWTYTDDVALPAFAVGGGNGLVSVIANPKEDQPYHEAILFASADASFMAGAIILYRGTETWKKVVKPNLSRLRSSESSASDSLVDVIDKDKNYKLVLNRNDQNSGLPPLQLSPKRKADWVTISTFVPPLVVMGGYGIYQWLTAQPETPEPESDDSESDEVIDSGPSDVLDPGDFEGAEEPTEPQLIVLPKDGLNLRTGHSTDAPVLTTFLYGAFLDEIGPRESDANGNEWIFVRALGADGRMQEGWVMARYVEEHPDGAMGETGRINPDLESQGYDWVDVQPGQTMGGIALGQDRDISQVVMLNMKHIIDPSRIYPGDRIYLPKQEEPLSVN